jgi:hypothetical protein
VDPHIESQVVGGDGEGGGKSLLMSTRFTFFQMKFPKELDIWKIENIFLIRYME